MYGVFATLTQCQFRTIGVFGLAIRWCWRLEELLFSNEAIVSFVFLFDLLFL